jgi:hypothetical protein
MRSATAKSVSFMVLLLLSVMTGSQLASGNIVTVGKCSAPLTCNGAPNQGISPCINLTPPDVCSFPVGSNNPKTTYQPCLGTGVCNIPVPFNQTLCNGQCLMNPNLSCTMTWNNCK